MLHIVFSHAVEQLLKQALMMRSTNFSGDVLSYECELQLGNLKDEKKRQQMWATVYQMEADADQVDTLIYADEQKVKRVKEVIFGADKVTFWVGETTADELAFLRLLFSLEINKKELQFNRFRGTLQLGDLLPSKIKKIYQPIPITEEMLGQLSEKWRMICEKGDCLRVRTSDFTYRFIDYTYFDQLLLKRIPKNEVMMAIIVGEIHLKEPEIPYFFFIWRLQILREKGHIEWMKEELGLKQIYIKRKKD